MRGGSVEVGTKNILYWFMKGQTHFGMPRGAKEHLRACNIFLGCMVNEHVFMNFLSLNKKFNPANFETWKKSACFGN
jgi:hypothetical protein